MQEKNSLQQWLECNHQSETDIMYKLRIWGIVSDRCTRAADVTRLEMGHALDFLVNTVHYKGDQPVMR